MDDRFRGVSTSQDQEPECLKTVFSTRLEIYVDIPDMDKCTICGLTM